MKTKTVLAICLLFSIASMLEVKPLSYTSTYADDEELDQNVLRSLAAMIPATYIVYSTGGNTYARPTAPGGTPYSDVDANCGTVINNALAAMSSGGRLVLTDMFTTGSTGLTVAHDGTEIVGLGWGTGITFTKATGTDDYAITIEEKDNCAVMNMKIVGAVGDGNHGVFVYGSDKFKIQNCWFKDVGEESIFVLRKGTSYCLEGDISHNLIEGGARVHRDEILAAVYHRLRTVS